ncbi:hypothetical protein KIPB_010135, partial [Kipferlia bialata]
PLLGFLTLGGPAVNALILSFLYMQVFKRVLKPSMYSTIHRCLLCSTVLVGMGLLCTAGLEQIYVDRVDQSGYEAWVAKGGYGNGPTDFYLSFRLLSVFAEVQMLVIVIALRAYVSRSNRALEGSMTHSIDQKRGPLTKLDILPVVYGLYCTGSIIVTILLWYNVTHYFNDDWANLAFDYCLVPAAYTEGCTLAIIVYAPNTAKRQSKRQRERRGKGKEGQFQIDMHADMCV